MRIGSGLRNRIATRGQDAPPRVKASSEFVSLKRGAGSVGLALALLTSICASAADAQPADSEASLPTVVVTATRSARAAFDVPASVDAVTVGANGDDKPNVNVSEYLDSVPGVVARNRQNYAQDEQISIRGFGAR
jgi:iron complex outermembrane receptor protein